VSQLETTLEILKDRSGDAVEAVQQGVQHGVEAIGTRLGVIEPPRRRRGRQWLLVLVVAAVAGLVWWQVRTRRAADEADEDEVAGGAPARSRSA
jgi:hypothetical protein